MSEIVQTKIILDGATWVRDYSLYLRFNGPRGRKDYLYELQTDNILAAQQDRWDEAIWNVFVSSGPFTEHPKARKRKLRWQGLTFPDAVNAIREDVIQNRKGYEVLNKPSWWAPLPKGELNQIGMMFARTPKASVHYDEMDAAAEDPAWFMYPCHRGWTARAHFWSHSPKAGRIRFDSPLEQDDQGIYVEHTEAMSILASLWGNELQEFVHDMHGTVLEGQVCSRDPNVKVEDILAEHGRGHEIGLLSFIVTDCLQVKHTPILDKGFLTRSRYAQAIVQRWKERLKDPRRAERLEAAPVHRGPIDKLQKRVEYLTEENCGAVVFAYRDGLYEPHSTTPHKLYEANTKQFFGVVTGYEEKGRWKKKGWISKIEIGVFVDGRITTQVAGSISVMPENYRQYISENRERVLGSVVEIRARGRTSNGGFQNPRLIAFRDDVQPEQCV